MSKMRKVTLCAMGIVALVLCVLILLVNYQNTKIQNILNLTKEQKLSDFDALCTILDESYPFWNEVQELGIDKEEIYDSYRTEIASTKTDIEFFKCMGYFLREFEGLGHLSVLDGYMYRLYKDTLFASNDILSPQEEQAIWPLVDVLENQVSQKTYSLLDQSHEGFRSTIGLKEEYENVEHSNETEEDVPLVTSIYDEGKTAYIKFDSFELTNYQEDKAILDDFYSQIANTSNLVIDIRGNGGGSDLYWEDLLVKPNVKEKLSSERYYLFNINEMTQDYISANRINAEEISSIPEPYLSQYGNRFSHYTVDRTSFEVANSPYQGKIWVLVDDAVYSAAENFVVFCKNTGFATLVGTATGGDGGIADPMLVSLPNSGLIVRFSMFYGLNADGSGNEANGTVPDIVISEEEINAALY